MADWPNWSTAYTKLTTEYAFAKLLYDSSGTNFADAWTHYYASQTLPCLYDLLTGVGALRSAIGNMLSYNMSYDNPYAPLWCFNYLYTNIGGTIDMDDILNAMLAATTSELTSFIGIEQAYMAAIWNAPFNGEYYAALARGWRQWQ